MESVDIQVAGMSCEGCENRLTAAITRVDGVDRVAADHESGRVRVLYDGGQVDEAKLREQLVACGFDPVGGGTGS